MPNTEGFDELFVEFSQTLRLNGLTIGSDDVISFCQAIGELNPGDMLDIYWAGRSFTWRLRGCELCNGTTIFNNKSTNILLS